MKLYEISMALQFALDLANKNAEDNNGEISEELCEQLDRLEGEKADKVLDIGRAIKNLSAEAEAIKAEEKALAARRKRAEAGVDWLKGYIATYAKGETFKDASCVVGWRKSEKTIVDDIDALSDEYKAVEVKPVLTAIKEAIKAGKEVAGAHIEENLNVTIK